MPRITNVGDLYVCALDENGDPVGEPFKLKSIDGSTINFNEESIKYKPFEHLKDVEVNLTIE